MPNPPDTARALLALGAATLGEAGGRAMRSRIKPAWPGARLAGPAFTVRCTPGDNLAIHVGVAKAPTGSVLVIDVGIERELGYVGEILGTAAQARGVVGAVIDGGVRDVAALERNGFAVFSSDVALKGATKKLPGSVQGLVEVGDVGVHAGDWVVGDVDGVTVIASERLDEVLAAGQARADGETQYLAELSQGRTTLEVLGIDPSPIVESQ